jgi:cell division septum initiation protein DivIVA
VDLNDKLDEIVNYVESARSMPMSSSSVVNRPELLGQLRALREMLPATLEEADHLLSEREQLLAKAQSEAEALVSAGQEERDRLISEHEVVTAAKARAEETLAAATAKADEISRGVDDYVDAKLAHLEVAVDRILETVRQGRERLRQTSTYADLEELGPKESV